MSTTTTTKAALANAIRQYHYRPRLCLLGSPGSGKGSYGQILARHWGIPIISASDILKQHQQQHGNSGNKDDMASGKLLDDQVVSETLLKHLESDSAIHDNNNSRNNDPAYLLDGFPRTLYQVHLMQSTWPSALQIQAVIHLNVPLEVCERKLLGRRICTVCGNHFNIHGVLSGGFDLPPKLPRPGECHKASALGTPSLPQQHNLARCDAHWIRRDDDQQEIIHHRLQIYAQHTRPILDHFQSQGRLFEFVPYRGFQDMGKLQTELEQWIHDNLPDSVVQSGG